MLTRVIRLLCLSLIVSALGTTAAEADVQAIANPASALGLARTPGGLAYIEVTDRTVREITLAGTPTRSFPIGANGSPTGLAVAPDGETYVSFDDGTTPGRIERYTAAGA